MKKKIIAAILCVAMVATFVVGCGGGGQQAPQPSGGEQSEGGIVLDGSWPAETVKIGFEAYDTTDTQFLAIQDYFDYLQKHFNIEFIYSEALASPEDELNFIDSCAAAGCKAIIGYYNLAKGEAIKEAIDKGMYYWGTEADGLAFLDNPMYLGYYTFIEEGATENGDFLGGYQMAMGLAESGCKHVFYCSGGAGMGVQMFLDRQAGFEAGILAAQAAGMDIQYDPATDDIGGWPDADDFAPAVGAKLANMDYDGAAVSFNAAALFQPVMEAGRADSIKLATIGGVNDMYLDFVNMGLISTIVYDCEEVVFGNCIYQILNAVTGHEDITAGADGSKGTLCRRWTIIDADTFNAVYEKHNSGAYYVTAEDIAGMLAEFNPAATHEANAAFYTALDLETALAK